MNQIRLYDIFRRDMHLADDKAADAVYALQEIVESSMTFKLDSLATKEDLSREINSVKKEMHSIKDDLYKAIYLSGFLQFIAMVGTVLAVVKFIRTG